MSQLTPDQSRALAQAAQNMSDEDRNTLTSMDQANASFQAIVRELKIDPPKLTDVRVTIETAADIMSGLASGDLDFDTALAVLKQAGEANL